MRLEEAKVLIAIPLLGDHVHAAFAKSLLSLDRSGYASELFWVEHTITSAGRNIAAAKALGEHFTHLFFMDSDMTFPAQCIKRLLSHDVDIVSGLYRPRRGNGQYFAFMFHDPTGMPIQVPEIDMSPGADDLLKVDGVPTGCLMIKASALRDVQSWQAVHGFDLPAPLFKYEDSLPVNQYLQAMAAADGRARSDVDVDAVKAKVGYGRGEDLYFCGLARRAGLTVYVDTKLTCGHLGMREIGEAAIYA